MKKLYKIIVLALLITNIVLNIHCTNAVKTKNNIDNDVKPRSVDTIIQEQIDLQKHIKEIGSKYLQVTNSHVTTTSYNSKYIEGTVANNHSKTINDVGVQVVFYKENEVIGYSYDSISKILPGKQMPFEIYVSDNVENFDKFEIEYLTGVVLE